MNFEQIQAIVKNIKMKVLCPHCQAQFTNQDIHILSSVSDKCVFIVQCHSCQAPLMITASLHGARIESQNKTDIMAALDNHIQTQAQSIDTQEEIVVDDILNVHEFLKDFSGDFSSMFNKPTSSEINHDGGGSV